MKRLSKKAVNTSKGIMIVVVSVLGTITLAACSINYRELADGINDIGRGMDHMVNGTSSARETEDPSDTDPTESSETDETAETPAPTATPTPAPTGTPVPTPTPMPDRVDFSELTTDEISDTLEVQLEEFAESHHDEEDGEELVTFAGNRMVLSMPENENIQLALNSLIDGFYYEAEGLYNRYSGEADAAYALDSEIYMEAPYAVSVNFSYSYNGRLLSVIKSYEVTQGEENIIDEKKEIDTYDVLTGNLVTPAMVAKDTTALGNALAASIAFAASTEEVQYTASQVTDPVIVVHAQGNGTAFAEAYGFINGTRFNAPVDLTNYADYLNSYGKIVYKINR